MAKAEMESVERPSIRSILLQTPVFTLPNILCLVRLSLLPVILYFLMQHKIGLSLLIVAIGVVTDLTDGFIARHMNQVSEFGKMLDPLVDKATVFVVLSFLCYRNWVHYQSPPVVLLSGSLFMFAIGVAYIVAFPLIVRKRKGVPLPNVAGKLSALFSGAAVIFYILEWEPWADAWMVVTVGMTIAAVVIYFIRDFHHPRNAKRISYANRATLLRVALSPLFLLVFFYDGNSDFGDNLWIFKLLALLLAISVAVSDRVDGVLARSRGETTDLGKLLDPFADKIALMTIFLCFAATGWASVWMVALIYYREAIISFLRTLAANERIVLAAMLSGKIKTVVQLTASITLLSLSFLRESADVVGLSVLAPKVFDIWDMVWVWVPESMMLLVTVVSVVSGIDYLWRNRTVLVAASRHG